MISAGTSATEASSDLMKTGKKEADGAAAVERTPNTESASVMSRGAASETGKSANLVQVTTLKSAEFSQDRAVRVTS